MKNIIILLLIIIIMVQLWMYESLSDDYKEYKEVNEAINEVNKVVRKEMLFPVISWQYIYTTMPKDMEEWWIVEFHIHSVENWKIKQTSLWNIQWLISWDVVWIKINKWFTKIINWGFIYK